MHGSIPRSSPRTWMTKTEAQRLFLASPAPLPHAARNRGLRSRTFFSTRKFRREIADFSGPGGGGLIEHVIIHGLEDLAAPGGDDRRAGFQLWRSDRDALPGRRRRERAGADRKSIDRALVSRLGDQTDDDLCGAFGGSRRQTDDGHAVDHVVAGLAHGAFENGLPARHRGHARQCAEDVDGEVSERRSGDGRRGYFGIGGGFRGRDERRGASGSG